MKKRKREQKIDDAFYINVMEEENIAEFEAEQNIIDVSALLKLDLEEMKVYPTYSPAIVKHKKKK